MHALTRWASRIQGRYLVLERDEWEARGSGYRGGTLALLATPFAGPTETLFLTSIAVSLLGHRLA